MGVTFRCDGVAMQEIKLKLECVQVFLGEAYKIGAEVEKEIASKSNWDSKSQKTMSAYMDLLIQYHADLAKGDTPLEKADEALGKLITNLGDFYEEWEEWKGLDDIV